MNLKQSIRAYLRNSGYDVNYFHRKKLFSTYNINFVLDVGANTGQFSKELRITGYKDRIVSFEPLDSAFKILQKKSKKDKLWEIKKYALGDSPGETEINISGNSYSSSILDMLPTHIKSAPDSKYIGKQKIEIKTLDSVFGELDAKGCNVFLKIDTQGYEKSVLEGAVKSLPLIDTLQLEMSFVPLYSGEALFDEMFQYLSGKGYSIVSIEPGFSDTKTGQLFQANVLFHRI